MQKSLLIKARPYGFFSNFLHLLDNLKYAEIKKLKPIIKFDNILYNDEKLGFFSYFFEPINDGIPIGEIEESDIMLLNSYIAEIPTYKLCLWNLVEKKNQDLLRNHRIEINSMISKYLKTTDLINQKIRKNKKAFGKILAVHMRCSDYNYGKIEKFISKNESDIKNFDSIYCASDSAIAINIIKNRFPNVFIQETDLRDSNLTSKEAYCLSLNGKNSFCHAQDVLVDAILLAEAKKLICINSNVSAAAAYFNPHMEICLLDRVVEGG